MGIVVLNGAERQTGFSGELGRAIIGVEIADNGVGGMMIQLFQVGDCLPEGLVGFGILKIAEMLAERDPPSGGNRNRILQMSSDGEKGAVRLDLKRERGIPARPSQDKRTYCDHPDDRVVERPDDRPVVNQEEIGDSGEPQKGVAFIGADRFLGSITAGGDDRKAELRHQEMMKGGVREENAEVRVVRSDRKGNRG